MVELSPAILTNDISDFRKKYSELYALSDYFNLLHIDFADGQLVKNTTVMPHDIKFIKSSPFTLIAHLMTYRPQKYFWEARKAGFKWVLVHFDAFDDMEELDHVIAHGKSMHFKVGLVINPEIPLHTIGRFLKHVDAVQLMGIHPGFQGKEFIPSTYDKVKELRALSKHAIIMVDGGVKPGIAKKLAANGANILVAGSAIIDAPNPKAAIEELKADIKP